MTRYAIGDIHGGSQTFKALLDRISLKHSDSLYLLGDYVDRGPDSKGVLDVILNLISSGYGVRPVRGNHDDMMLRTFSGDLDAFSSLWFDEWGKETIKSFGVNAMDMISPHYFTLLDSIPYIQTDDDFVYVHAGLNMQEDDPIRQSAPMEMMWGDVSKVDSRKLGGRKMVTGHKVRPLPLIEVSLLSNRIYIDNGAFTNMQPDMGNLVALNIDDMNLTVQPWLDEESVW